MKYIGTSYAVTTLLILGAVAQPIAQAGDARVGNTVQNHSLVGRHNDNAHYDPKKDNNNDNNKYGNHYNYDAKKYDNNPKPKQDNDDHKKYDDDKKKYNDDHKKGGQYNNYMKGDQGSGDKKYENDYKKDGNKYNGD
ncbi:hypothetical protein E3Q22_03936, partial [Wallemia mellicola]